MYFASQILYSHFIDAYRFQHFRFVVKLFARLVVRHKRIKSVKGLPPAAYKLYLTVSHYALESGGVDNWDWYGESIRDFLRENEVKHFKDLIEKELKEYEVVT